MHVGFKRAFVAYSSNSSSRATRVSCKQITLCLLKYHRLDPHLQHHLVLIMSMQMKVFYQKLEFPFLFHSLEKSFLPIHALFSSSFYPSSLYLLFIKIERIIFLRNALLTAGSFVSCFTRAETGNQINIYSLVRTHIPPTQMFEWKPAL